MSHRYGRNSRALAADDARRTVVRCEQCRKRAAKRLGPKNRCPGCGFLLCPTCHPEGCAAECKWCRELPEVPS